MASAELISEEQSLPCDMIWPGLIRPGLLADYRDFGART
jgi:hypothetical protein